MTRISAKVVSTKTLKGAEIKQFDFRKQTDNFNEIVRVLERNNIEIDEMVIQYIESNKKPKRLLVDITLIAGKFTWRKYESGADGAGQNHVIVSGERLRTSEFLGLYSRQQDKLLTQGPSSDWQNPTTRPRVGFKGFDLLEVQTLLRDITDVSPETSRLREIFAVF